jgi:hypothetical protein
MYHYDFFLASSLEKVLPGKRPRPLENAVIPVFPGGIPALQLVYSRHNRSGKGSAKQPFRVSVEGAPVPPVLRRVDLVPVDFPANEDGHDSDYLALEPAMLPDLLVGLEDGIIYPETDLYNAVWIDFPGISAGHRGRHEVTVTLSAEGETTEKIPFVLDVMKESLPPQTLFHTQWFHTDCLASYYRVEPLSEEHWRIIDAFMEPMMSRYGINTVLTPVFTPPLDTAVGGERPTVQLVDISIEGDSYTFNFKNLERWCGLCKKHGITHLEIAHFFTQWGAKATPKIVAREKGVEKKIFGWDVPSNSPKYRRFLEAFIPALRRECAKYGFDKDHTIFHVSDESGDETYKTAKSFIADLVEGSIIIDANGEFNFYKEGIIEHPVVPNSGLRPFLEAKVPGLWTYYCCCQGYKVPNRFIALPSPRCRAMGVLMYLYNIEGFLQWGYNFYYSALSKSLVNPFLKTGGLRNWPAGDPFIVYPGEDGKPLSSIRGEVHRESLEDMRVLALVEAKAGREAALRIIHEDFPGEMSFEHYPEGASYYLGLREKAAAVLRAYP